MQARLYSLERRGMLQQQQQQQQQHCATGGERLGNGHVPDGQRQHRHNNGANGHLYKTGGGVCGSSLRAVPQRTPSVGYDSMPMSPATPNEAAAAANGNGSGNSAGADPPNGHGGGVKIEGVAPVTDVIMARPDLCKVMTASSDSPILVRMRDKTAAAGGGRGVASQQQRASMQCADGNGSNGNGGSPKDASARRLSRNRLSRLLNSIAGRSRNSSVESPMRGGKNDDSLRSGRSEKDDEHAHSLDRELANLTISSDDSANNNNNSTEADNEADTERRCMLALDAARRTPMAQWTRAHVAGWALVELSLDASAGRWRRFCTACPNGNRLLAAASSESAMHEAGLDAPLLRRKFRLALEYYRSNDGRVEPVGPHSLGWRYVSENWLPALGLDQYSEAFAQSRVDGRLLGDMAKKHYEKQLGVRNKFHLASIMKGVELLAMFQYDAQALEARRRECLRHNADLLVWSNERLQQWLHTIGMGAYASRLRQSGLHGALMVLDKSFSHSTFISALHIASGKRMAKKHLWASLGPLLSDARVQLEHCPPGAKLEDSDQHVNDAAPLAHIAMMHSGTGAAGERKRRGRSQSPGTVAACNEQRHSNGSDDTPKRRANALRSSFGKLFSNNKGQQQQAAASGSSQPAPPPQTHMVGHNLDDLPVAAHLTPSLGTTPNGGLAGRDAQKTPLSVINTWSSTTSDLGSSIERSHHMRAILGHTPQVLATSCGASAACSSQQSAPPLLHASKSTPSAAHSRRSPQPNAAGLSMGVTAIKMRSRSAVFAGPYGNGANGFVSRRHQIAVSGHGPARGPHSAHQHASTSSARPHSVSDLAALAQHSAVAADGPFDADVRGYYEAVAVRSPVLSIGECGGQQHAAGVTRQQRRRAKGVSACAELLSSSSNYTSAADYYINGSFMTSAVATPPRRQVDYSPALFVANRHHIDWAAAGDVGHPQQQQAATTSSKVTKIDIKMEQHEIGTISEQTEPDQESSSSLALNNQPVGDGVRFNERRPSSLAIDKRSAGGGGKRPNARSQETDL